MGASKWLVVMLLGAAIAVAAADDSGFLQGVDEKVVAKDPILYKADYGAKYAASDLEEDALDSTKAEVVKGEKGGVVAQCATSPNYNLIITFNATGDEFDDLAGADQADLKWLEDAIGLDDVTAAKPVADAFSDINADLKKACDKVLEGVELGNSSRPLNALITGSGSGASLAVVGATWAAVNYPSAHLLLQSYGAEWPSTSARFNWTFNQVVDQFYLWPTKEELKEIGSGKLAEYTLPEVFEKLEDGGIFTDDLDDIIDDMRLLMERVTVVPVIGKDKEDAMAINSDDDHGNATSTEAVAAQTVATDVLLADWANSTYGQQLNETGAAYLASQSECPIILCKTRVLLLAAGGIYNIEGYESSPISAYFPDNTAELHGESDADAVVAWDAKARAAYIIVEGTTSGRDIINDIQFIQRDYPGLSDAQERVWDEPEVAKGFLKQMDELTEDAEDEDSIEVQLKKMMGDDEPLIIYIAGHSLGGAVATALGPWAASKWPKASILTTSSGSPRVGDQAFKNFYKGMVGRQFRYVQEWDIVPAMPPLNYVKHVDFGLWIHDGKVVAEDRPQKDLFDHNAEDHNSYLYSLIPSEVGNITIPSWVKNLE